MRSECMADILTQNIHLSWDTDNQEAQRTLRLSALWSSTNSFMSLLSILPHTSQVADSANYRSVRWSGFTWHASSQYGFTPTVR